MDVKVTTAEKLFTNVAVAGSGGLILWDSLSLQGGSAYFPVTVGIALIVFSLISGLAVIRNAAAVTMTSEASLLHGMAGLVLTAGFVWSASTFGFLTSTLWFLPAMAVLGGERHWLRIVLMTLGFSAIAWLVFGLVFAQTMPPELIFGELG